jgi:hypothetical protein
MGSRAKTRDVLVQVLHAEATAAGLGPIDTYLAAHPRVVEIDPAQRAIRYAREVGMRLHSLEITSRGGRGAGAAGAAGRPAGQHGSGAAMPLLWPAKTCRCVMHDGAVIGRPGHGQLVRPSN